MKFWRALTERFKAAEKPPGRPERGIIAGPSLRDRWSGYPSSGLTPGRLAAILREADQGYLYRQMELFEEMEEKDAHLAAVLQTRKQAVLGLEYRVTPYSEDARDQEAAAWCEEALARIGNFDEALLDLLDAVGKGLAATEIVWGYDGRRAVVEGLQWIHPKRLGLWESLTPRILTDDDLVRGIEPPPYKVIVHRYRSRSGHDTRAGVLRVCAYMYLFKNLALKDWATFCEVFGMPLRLGKYPAGATEADKAALVAAVRSLGSDAYGVISQETQIEFVEAAGRLSGVTNPYQVLAEFCNREMSKAVLGQTLTTDTTGATGTYAAGQVHQEVRRDLLEADAEALAATIRQQLLRPLVGFNFGWDATLPYFEFALEEEEDLRQVAETYEILGRMGYPLTKEHLSERFGVPLPEPGQELVGGQQSAAGGPEPENGGDVREIAPGRAVLPLRAGGGLELTEGDRRVAETQQALESLAAAAMAASSRAAAKMLAPVRALVAAGASLEEIRDGLLTAYPEMDMEQLGELLYQASMLAWMSGRQQ